MLYDNRYPSCFDELISRYPLYYRSIYEMVEILKQFGRLFDRLQKDIERVVDNQFILSADEEAVAEYERFCGIPINRSKPLEERRALLLAYFAGMGHMSASKIKNAIRLITNSDSDITFDREDEQGNKLLDITVFSYLSESQHTEISNWLARFLPAHLFSQLKFSYHAPIPTMRINGASTHRAAVHFICKEE